MRSAWRWPGRWWARSRRRSRAPRCRSGSRWASPTVRARHVWPASPWRHAWAPWFPWASWCVPPRRRAPGHRPQERQARGLRHGRGGRRGGEPGVRHPRPGEAARLGERGRGRAPGAALRPSAQLHRAARHEVGRGVADHVRGVPRPRHGLRRGARADLRADRGMVRLVHHAPGHDGGHPPHARGDRAGAPGSSGRSSRPPP